VIRGPLLVLIHHAFGTIRLLQDTRTALAGVRRGTLRWVMVGGGYWHSVADARARHEKCGSDDSAEKTPYAHF